MYWLIESQKQLQEFSYRSFKECFLEVIPLDYEDHPVKTKISLLFIYVISINKSFIISLDHNESLSLNIDKVKHVISDFNVVYVRDKKYTLHFFQTPNLIDSEKPLKDKEDYYTPAHSFFYKQNIKNRNKIIPIVKHYEFYQKVLKDINFTTTVYNKFLDKSSLVFCLIEQNGIKINKQLFEKCFYKEENDFVYTQYNLKNKTTRPSNTFNGINYNALNKNNGCRQSFIPSNSKFVELDISAYHPNLISDLIDYNFNGVDIHQHFAELYNCSYEEAKYKTFQQLYGNVFEEYKDLEFFKKVKLFKNKLWEEYNKNGFVEIPISNYKLENIKDTNKNKLFNYFIQGYETSLNVKTLYEISKFLLDKNSKIVLYVYDSILLDWDENENIINEIKSYFKYPVTTKIGENYDNLKKI